MHTKLAVIGSSPGNGHPYSWSSIFNGFDKQCMENYCPFPAIPQYLANQAWPDAQIPNANVDAIWTQDELQSYMISKASLIPNIYKSLDDLIRNYSCLLLARDDSENHYAHCSSALNNGSFVYIDKPIALNEAALDSLYEACVSPAHLFSCSALSFCPDILSFAKQLANPDLKEIAFTSPKGWNQYAVHLIDPFITALTLMPGLTYQLGSFKTLISSAGSISLSLKLELSTRTDEIIVSFTTTGMPSGHISYATYSKNDRHLLSSGEHIDSFFAFRAALSSFIQRINTQSESDHFTYAHHSQVVRLLSQPFSS